MQAKAEFARFFLNTRPVLRALLIHPAKVYFSGYDLIFQKGKTVTDIIFDRLRNVSYRRACRAAMAVIIAVVWVAAPRVAPAGATTSASERATLLNESWTGDFDGMVKRRRIRVMVVYSKTYYFLDQGRQRGLSYDLLKEFENYINKKLKTGTLKIQIIFIPVRRDEIISGLVKGYGDIAVANLTITPQRQKQVEFSDPWMTGVKELLVTGPAAPSVASVDDLAGKEVHVRKSSSYYESLLQLNATFKKAGRQPIRLVIEDEVFQDEDLLEMVNAGLIPLIIVDSHKALFWEQIFDRIKVHPDIAVRTGGDIAWAFRKNSPQLKTVVNEFVKGHKKGTLLGNMLFKRYLRDNQYVKNSVSEQEMKKFRAMVQYFRTYADRYDFDYLMIGAQAYQESGLDHSKRSPAGAIGVMQILPSTAADPNVGIPDIEKLENNIHAGTKYLRFIVDRYFNEPSIDKVNRMLFAFAAYNAGPARINGLRKKTAKKGLDPNVWFHNVEMAAAQEIGRETVQYVSNIYKYYIAYHVLTAQRKAKEQMLKKK
ncbi:MAG: lytic transglycosylase F [Desulfobacteraceae bacterium]|jgi:membrane-bound lytic murein transglycosylase MltF